MSFKPVSAQVDFIALEKELLEYWYKEGIVEKYLKRNEASEKKFSFLDGPKTANNPLGVHHAWGRTYKDLWQRYFNMRGFRQRFQNGYDEQGLWVEVEVEKNLGLKSKKDIENIVPGDKLASLEKFIGLCKERVAKFSDVITDQSIRLGQFMDWDNSYHTSSDQNNYMIWHFLKNVYQRGWLYKGHDSVAWCPRCGTAISQHEMQTEDYKELTHESIYFKLPVVGKDKEYLLVWTTTPWTIPANVAVAVNPDEIYEKYPVGDEYLIVMQKTVGCLKKEGILPVDEISDIETISGIELVGLEYTGPFDDLERVKKALGGQGHKVVAGDEQILAVSSEDGTGLVHVAPGAGTEDFQLGKKYALPVIDVIAENADYLNGLGEFSGKNAKVDPHLIFKYLTEKEQGRFLLKIKNYTHRYPVCWRCKSELVWRVVDEWYISVNNKDPKNAETFRQKMIKVAKEMTWQPKFVESRELDWLENLHDWLISKKRYWGLALPIWECLECRNFEVIGGFEELKEKAVEGWDKFEGHSPHRPWIDEIKIKCSKCGGLVSRIPDVGNPWLDAGIVPYSTVTPKAGEIPSYLTDKKYWSEWFPTDFSVEMYEQTRLWFYAMIAMSSVLEEKPPVERIFGHGKVVDEKGEEMHGSKGNAVSLDEAFDKVGADAMRWLYLSANPAVDLRFGYNLINDAKRRFILTLWNCYKFFVEYANFSNWEKGVVREESILDKWVLSRLTETVNLVNKKLENYDAMMPSRCIEAFVNDFSTWYIRRSRDRVGPEADESERNTALSVMYEVLVTLSKLLAPFTPFLAEEIYRNLTGKQSVHLTDYPEAGKNEIDKQLLEQMSLVRQVVEQGHAKRKEVGIKLRQPLASASYNLKVKLNDDLEKIIAEELNVKAVEYKKASKEEFSVQLNTNLTPVLKEEGRVRELIRQIQQLRKDNNLTFEDKTRIEAPEWPKNFEAQILKSTTSVSISKGAQLKVSKV